MLKPFQIRDLHGSPTQEDAFTSLDYLPQGHHGHNTSRRSGIVQLSASDYDEIALSHPRARLTYVDDDDGDIITVGSSLELSQRLDEPIYDMPIQANPTQESTIPETMHIFDIRRSNSVTELWKRFEYNPAGREIEGSKNAVESTTDKCTFPLQDGTESNAEPTNESSESLLAAFETEMAKILSASGPCNTNNAEEIPSTQVPNESASSGRRTNPAVALAQAMHHLINGAEMVGSEVRSRLPELEHQLEHHLQNAQRVLPENVGSTVQAALASLDAQMRNLTNALNNASSARDRRTSNIFRGEVPTPAEAVDSLYAMASELGQMGHTLYSAFETEFGSRIGARDASQPSDESLQNPAPPDEAAVNREPSAEDSVSNTKTEKEATIPLTAEEPDTTSREQGSKIREEPRPFSSRTEEPGLAQCVPSQQDEPSELPESVRHGPPTFDLPYRPRPWRRFPHPPHCRSHHQHHPHPHSRPHPPPPPPQRHHDIHPHPHPPHPPHHPHYHHQHQPLPFPPPPPPHQHHHIPPPPHPPHPSHPSPIPRPPWGAQGAFPPLFPPHPHAHDHSSWRSAWPFFRPHQEHQSEAPTAATGQVPDAGAGALRSANAVLFIGNVGFNVSEKTIRDVFAAKGFLVDVHLPLDVETRKHAGFGYLYFPSIHAARAALDALQGTHIDGHSINLELSDHSPITSLHPDQAPGWGDAGRPSELHSSANPSSGIKPERREVGQDDEGITAREKRPIPLSVADLCLSDEGTVQVPKGKKIPSTTPDNFPRLTRDLEHSRFPPMSQEDAHVLTHHRRDTDTPKLGASAPECDASHGNDVAGRSYQLQSTPGSFPDDDGDETQSGPFQELAHSAGTGHDDHLLVDFTTRDAPTTTIPILSGTLVLRASVPDENEQQLDPRQSAIDDCVASLIGLGYENTLEGGIQRIAVYAAAADGKISDAIEMIEEERKAYEQQGL
ncbi:hypothetical protein Asppvi_006495 [Aspergillus pseudoviridinutans]|uniref:RRM domain-containing protein n=1 Tax=Aspergillus pseudoviridinutans TaxID=1517512 RepID=A0A9P3BE15_9EURO|nr:uncharacterized protein Asppvi_006495 [Aspergillus pseudoviridinutans]GIJ87585.1 hypothetical protein Asppvi_006495 [Aspergillus pseudoviridinutans]